MAVGGNLLVSLAETAARVVAGKVEAARVVAVEVGAAAVVAMETGRARSTLPRSWCRTSCSQLLRAMCSPQTYAC